MEPKTSPRLEEVDAGSRQRARLEELVELILEARLRLGSGGPFSARVLLDMMLLELGRELAAVSGEDPV